MVEVITRAVIRAIRFRGRRVVRHRRIGNHLVLMRRICIRRIRNRDGIAVRAPVRVEGDVARDRRVFKVVSCGRRISLLVPMLEGMARKVTCRRTLARLRLRSCRKVSVLHGLRDRRHIAALRVKGDRIARKCVAVVKGQCSGQRRIRTTAFLDLLCHRERCAALRDFVVKRIDLGGAAVSITGCRARKLRNFIVVVARKRKGNQTARRRSGRSCSEAAVA